MEPDEDPTTDEIVAAFRSRRQAADAGTPVQEAQPAPPPALGKPAAPAPMPPASTSDPAPDLAPMSAPPLASRPGPAAEPVRPQAQLPAVRPAVQGGGMALTASGPGLNLSSRLLEDRLVARAGSRTGVALGVALALAGLAMAAASQALVARGLLSDANALDLGGLGLAGAAIGLALAGIFLVLPRRRSLRVRLAATQQQEWSRVSAEARRLRAWSIVGAAAAFVGLGGATAAYAVLDQPLGGYAGGALAGLAIAGTILLAWAAARRGLVQRLYVQTLVLSRLEQTGLGPSAAADPRIAPVLRSLDQLLGALPESAVRRFLASDEATQYLELIDDLSKDPGHGR